MGIFEKIEGHPEPNEADVNINTKKRLDISGSHETMRNALTLIVWRIFRILFTFQECPKFELLSFSSVLDEICYWE